jgi:plastocyanin
MRLTLLAVAAAVALTLGACSASTDGSGGTAPAPGGREVVAVDNEFRPTELRLPAGQEVTVTFRNEGRTIHTFTSEELGVDTGNVEPGSSVEVTFTVPDQEVRFVCTIHETSDDMVGAVVPQ